MGVLEPAALEIGHGVGLAPDDIVEDPEIEVLERGADAEDIVIGTDDPDGAVRLQHAAAGEQPGAGEGIIGLEGGELVPFVVDGINERLIGPVQRAAKLEVIRRIGENRVHRLAREGIQGSDAITLYDAVFPGVTLTCTIKTGMPKIGQRKNCCHWYSLHTLTLY